MRTSRGESEKMSSGSGSENKQDLLPQYPIKILKEKETPSVNTEGHSCAPTAHLP